MSQPFNAFYFKHFTSIGTPVKRRQTKSSADSPTKQLHFDSPTIRINQSRDNSAGNRENEKNLLNISTPSRPVITEAPIERVQLQFPVKLETCIDWLADRHSRERHKIYNNRAMFYIIAPQALLHAPPTKKSSSYGQIIKVGRSGIGEQDSTHIGRLRQYLYHYGFNNAKTRCSGANVHLLLFSSPETIIQLEQHVNEKLKKYNAYGREWFRVDPKIAVETTNNIVATMQTDQHAFKNWSAIKKMNDHK